MVSVRKNVGKMSLFRIAGISYFNTTVTSLVLLFTIYLIFYAITLCFIMFICPFVSPLIGTNKILFYLSIYLSMVFDLKKVVDPSLKHSLQGVLDTTVCCKCLRIISSFCNRHLRKEPHYISFIF